MATQGGAQLKQSTARIRTVYLTATSLTPTVTISKNGGAFGALGGSIAEISGGWYAISLNTTDTNTLGDLAYIFSTGTDPNICDQVVVDLPGATVNVTQWGGHAVVATNVNGVPIVDLGYVLGTASAGAVGYVGIDWSAVNAPTTAVNLSGTTIAITQRVDVNTVKTQTVTCAAGVTVNVNVGTTQPVNFTGSAGAALVKTDVTDIATVAVATGTAQLGVNVVNWAAQTALLDANNLPKVDVDAIKGDQTAASNLQKSASVIVQGAITSAPTTTTFRDTSLTQADAGFFIGRILLMTSGTQKYQASAITGFTVGTHQLTFNALTTAPAIADTYIIV